MTTREDIIKMAREVGLDWLMHNWFYKDHLQHFFHMAQAAEREARARVCSEVAAECLHPMQRNAALHCGHAIRARGQA